MEARAARFPRRHILLYDQNEWIIPTNIKKKQLYFSKNSKSNLFHLNVLPRFSIDGESVRILRTSTYPVHKPRMVLPICLDSVAQMKVVDEIASHPCGGRGFKELIEEAGQHKVACIKIQYHAWHSASKVSRLDLRVTVEARNARSEKDCKGLKREGRRERERERSGSRCVPGGI